MRSLRLVLLSEERRVLFSQRRVVFNTLLFNAVSPKTITCIPVTSLRRSVRNSCSHQQTDGEPLGEHFSAMESQDPNLLKCEARGRASKWCSDFCSRNVTYHQPILSIELPWQNFKTNECLTCEPGRRWETAQTRSSVGPFVK